MSRKKDSGPSAEQIEQFMTRTDPLFRLDVLEEKARQGIREKWRMVRFIRRQVTPRPPVLLPGSFRGILYGPDGRKLED